MRSFFFMALTLCVGCGTIEVSPGSPEEEREASYGEEDTLSLEVEAGDSDEPSEPHGELGDSAEGPDDTFGPDGLEMPVEDVMADASAADVGSETEPDVGPETEPDVGFDAPLYPDLPETLEASIYTKMEAAKVPGLSACVIKEEAIYWCGGFGKANLALDRDVSAHTPFLLASISKTFTAALVIQLRDEGAFDLDEDLDTLLGWDVAHPLYDLPLTMFQLLTHTSGIDDNWGAMGDFYGYDEDPPMSLQEAVEGYFQPEGPWYDAASNFTSDAPGASVHYSNMGVALAGHMVELASGQSFAKRSRDTLFEPLGLENTGIFLADFPSSEGLAMPYKWVSEAYVPTGHYTFADYPNGGIRSSAYDLARFLLMHIRGGELDGVQVLKSESVAEMLSPQVPVDSGEQGLIWGQLSWSGHDWWGHNGSEKGVFTEMYVRSADSMGFVVLTNGDANNPYPIYDIEDALMAWAEESN